MPCKHVSRIFPFGHKRQSLLRNLERQILFKSPKSRDRSKESLVFRDKPCLAQVPPSTPTIPHCVTNTYWLRTFVGGGGRLHLIIPKQLLNKLWPYAQPMCSSTSVCVVGAGCDKYTGKKKTPASLLLTEYREWRVSMENKAKVVLESRAVISKTGCWPWRFGLKAGARVPSTGWSFLHAGAVRRLRAFSPIGFPPPV